MQVLNKPAGLRVALSLCLPLLLGFSSPGGAFADHAAGSKDVAAISYTWKSVPIGGGGYVLDVYCHPKQKDLVYIRTDVGGFYRWDPGNKSWIPLTDAFRRDQSNYYGGEGLALDPSDPNVVYIAAGKYTYESGSIFKSVDQGRTWKKLPIDLKMGGNEDLRWGGQRLAVSPAHAGILLFGSRKEGLWRSSDAGASWAKVTAFPGKPKDGYGITAVAFAPETPGRVYAAAFGDGVYVSDDDGSTWQRTPDGPGKVARLAASPDGALYATQAPGVLRLVGGAWKTITPTGVTGGFGGVSIDPRDPNDILIAAQKDHLELYRSRDAGATWARKKTVTKSSVPWYSSSMKQIQYVGGVTFDPCVPDRVWLTDWYATYETESIDAEPAMLANHELGHEELVIFSLCAPPTGAPLFSGVADVDGFPHDSLDIFPTHGFGEYYGGSGPAFGDTDQVTWTPAAPGFLARVGVKRWDNTGGVTLSRDGGKTWAPAVGWDPKIMPGRVAVSSADADDIAVLRIGAGSGRFTRDGGKTWQEISGLPEKIITDVWNWQMPLAADGAERGVFYAAAGKQVFRSDDSGATFAPCSMALPGSAETLATVPGSAGEIYANRGSGGLFHSTDRAASFRPVASVRQVVLFAVGKPAPSKSAPTLYLYGSLTDGRSGIFRSVDGGRGWETIDDMHQPIGDVPNSMTASWQTFGLVFIGTNGRGIYYGAPTTSLAGGNS